MRHVAARWLALPWITIRAFIRIATNSRIWPNPLPAKQVFAIIEKWISQPGVIVLEPGPRHTEILKGLIIDQSVTGAMVPDAVLAALALENGAFLASADQDFRRFPILQWRNQRSDCPLRPSQNRSRQIAKVDGTPVADTVDLDQTTSSFSPGAIRLRSAGSLVIIAWPALRAQTTTCASTMTAVAVRANNRPTAVASGPSSTVRSVPACRISLESRA